MKTEMKLHQTKITKSATQRRLLIWRNI